MKITQKQKDLIKEIGIVISLSTMILLSSLADFSVITIPNIFIEKIKNTEDLFITLFSVQAGISTISIAVVSILTGVINDTLYGIPVSQYITNLKSQIFNHKTLMISSLCITAINYFCLSYSLFNLSIAFFIVSIVINILLVDNAYIIFLGKNKINSEIFNYLIENYNKKHITNLTTETLNAVETGNSLKVKENYEAFKSIFEKEIKRSESKETEIITQLSDSISDIFEKVVYEHNSRKTNNCILFICNIYDIANNSSDTPLYLKIWNDIYSDYFKGIKDLDFEQLIDDYVHMQLPRKLYDNAKTLSEPELKECRLRTYSSNIYYSLLCNENKFSSSQIERIKNDIYSIASVTLFYSNEYSELKNIQIQELCYLHKIMIEKGDCEEITRYYFERSSYKKLYFVYIVTLIYLYYLSSRENLLTEKPLQKNAQKILDKNKSNISYFYSYIELSKLTKQDYTKVYSFLDTWEYMDYGKTKWCIMDKVIQDFFIFSLLSEYRDKKLLLKTIPLITSNDNFSIYSRYFSNENYTYLKEEYQKYNKLFAKELKDEQLMDRILLLHNVLGTLYQQEELSKSRKNAITNSMLEDLNKKCINKVNSIIKSNLDCFSFKSANTNNPQVETIKEKNICIFENVVFNSFFDENEFERYYEDCIHESLITTFLRTILSNLNFQEIPFTERNKQFILIENFKSLNIHGNVFIGNRDRLWNEENKSLLYNFTSDMKHIKYPLANNNYFILDRDLIEFSFKNIHIEYSDFEWDNIKEKCRIDKNGNITYKITNDLYIPFEKSELEEYIHNTEKIISIYADIEYRVLKDKVGAGMQFIYRDNNKT